MNASKVRRYLPKIFIYFIAVIFTLALLEVLLQTMGFLASMPKNQRNQIHREDQNKLRILAIGESTTADYFAPDNLGAWPRKLEKKLLENGIAARVYNEGVGVRAVHSSCPACRDTSKLIDRTSSSL